MIPWPSFEQWKASELRRCLSFVVPTLSDHILHHISIDLLMQNFDCKTLEIMRNYLPFHHRLNKCYSNQVSNMCTVITWLNATTFIIITLVWKNRCSDYLKPCNHCNAQRQYSVIPIIPKLIIALIKVWHKYGIYI